MFVDFLLRSEGDNSTPIGTFMLDRSADAPISALKNNREVLAIQMTRFKCINSEGTLTRLEVNIVFRLNLPKTTIEGLKESSITSSLEDKNAKRPVLWLGSTSIMAWNFGLYCCKRRHYIAAGFAL